jgi:carbonic anhydrase/acetyltransferase-like protein (isoleucine patch superfamily)
VGDVVLGDQCSVWFQAVIRGDVNTIRIGDRTNIQDGAVIHCTYKTASTVIGNDVSIGHNAIIHGCTVEDGALIGMGAIVMDHAVVGAGSLVAAGAVVLGGTQIPPGVVYAGIPAKLVKEIDDRLKEMITRTPKNYIMYADWFD